MWKNTISKLTKQKKTLKRYALRCLFLFGAIFILLEFSKVFVFF